MGWTAQGSNPRELERFFLSPIRLDRLLGPRSLLFKGYRGSFPGVTVQRGSFVYVSCGSGAQLWASNSKSKIINTSNTSMFIVDSSRQHVSTVKGSSSGLLFETSL